MSLFQSEPSEQPTDYCRILLHKKRSRSCHVRPRSVRLEQEHPLLPVQLLKKEGGKTKTEVNFISCWRNAAPLFALHTCPLFLPAHSLESLRILLLRTLLSPCWPLYPPTNLSLCLSSFGRPCNRFMHGPLRMGERARVLFAAICSGRSHSFRAHDK